MYPRGQHRLSMGGQRCQSTTVATKSASVRFWWNIRRMRQAAVVAESEEKSTGNMEMRRDSQKTAMIDLTKRKNLLVRKLLFFIYLFYSRTDFSKVLIWWTAYRSNLKMIAKRYKIFSNLILDLPWKLLSLFFLEWKEHDYFESDNFVGNRILGIILYIVQLVHVCLVTHIGNCKQGLTNKLELL